MSFTSIISYFQTSFRQMETPLHIRQDEVETVTMIMITKQSRALVCNCQSTVHPIFFSVRCEFQPLSKLFLLKLHIALAAYFDSGRSGEPFNKRQHYHKKQESHCIINSLYLLSSLCFLLEFLLPAGGALIQVPFILHLQGSNVKKKLQPRASWRQGYMDEKCD